MLELILGSRTRPLHVLCIGAHSDDIEIGCGGTVLRLIEERPDIRVAWAVLSTGRGRRAEAQLGAKAFLAGAAARRVSIKNFRGSYFPQQSGSIKSEFERLKKSFPEPDLILTHYRHDLHQDHRIVSELTWNTWRNNAILEYEIPKWDGDLGIPNLFVPLSRALVEKKARTIYEVFGTQKSRQWFSEDTFLALARIRGIESGSALRFAEAFHARKLVLAPAAANVGAIGSTCRATRRSSRR